MRPTPDLARAEATAWSATRRRKSSNHVTFARGDARARNPSSQAARGLAFPGCRRHSGGRIDAALARSRRRACGKDCAHVRPRSLLPILAGVGTSGFLSPCELGLRVCRDRQDGARGAQESSQQPERHPHGP
jgi:hypothetical protein